MTVSCEIHNIKVYKKNRSQLRIEGNMLNEIKVNKIQVIF